MNERAMGLYVHFPFCVRKCSYCDFLSYPLKEAEADAYLKRLLDEIIYQGGQYSARRISTIFIGGGTPSLMREAQLERLIGALKAAFHIAADAEITIESNPGTLSLHKLRHMRRLGINRLSIGLQSADDKMLKALGRIHTWSDFLNQYDAARNAGFNNINIDMMSALPGQRTKDYARGLKAVLGLQPEHLSAYSLIIEEGTPFYNFYHGQPSGLLLEPLPDEDDERQMYYLTKSILQAHGYERYEISNYARPGFECRHNIIYWTCGDYLGLGLGASSLIGQKRFTNTRDLQAYNTLPLNALAEDIIPLDLKAQMEEFMFLGLRLTKGVSLSEFFKRFHKHMTDVYGSVISRHTELGTLTYNKDKTKLLLTEKGLDVSNYVMSDFLF